MIAAEMPTGDLVSIKDEREGVMRAGFDAAAWREGHW